jgi:hypothetical protein
VYAVTAPMQGLSFFQGEEGQSRFRGVAEKLQHDEVGHLIKCESSSSSPCSTLVVEGDHAASLRQPQRHESPHPACCKYSSQVRCHRVRGDAQSCRDLFTALTLRDPCQDGALGQARTSRGIQGVR